MAELWGWAAHLVHVEASAVAHEGQGRPKVVRVAVVVVSLHLVQLGEAATRQLPVLHLHVVCNMPHAS